MCELLLLLHLQHQAYTEVSQCLYFGPYETFAPKWGGHQPGGAMSQVLPDGQETFYLWEQVLIIPLISELKGIWDSAFSVIYFPSLIYSVRRLGKRRTHSAVQREGSKLQVTACPEITAASMSLYVPLNDSICNCVDYFERKCYATYLKYVEEGQKIKQVQTLILLCWVGSAGLTYEGALIHHKEAL